MARTKLPHWQDRRCLPYRRMSKQERSTAVATKRATLGFYTSQGKAVNPVHEVLTPAECRVLRSLSSGSVRKVIASDLGVAKRTVETHFDNARAKLRRAGYRADTDIEIFKACLEIGVITPDFLKVS